MVKLSEADVQSMLLPDLRKELRARGLNPGGGLHALRERLSEAIKENPEYLTKEQPVREEEQENTPAHFGSGTTTNNNFARPEGGNLDNFLTDKPTSRVLAPPGGKSNTGFLFGGE